MKNISSIIIFVLISVLSCISYSLQPGPNASPHPRAHISGNVEYVIEKSKEPLINLEESISEVIPLNGLEIQIPVLEDIITILDRKFIQTRIGQNVDKIQACGSYYIISYRDIEFTGGTVFGPGSSPAYNIVSKWIKVYKPYFSSDPEKIVFIFDNGSGKKVCD